MNLFRFAVATTLATFVLLLVGGTVNPAGASLACPDWPLCYGQLFPAMENGVQYEHTHRLVAAAVGVMTLILAGWIWRSRPEAKGLGVLAVALVVAQGLLGGVTVLLKLPTAVSTAHLALSMIFFGLLIYLCFRLWPGRRSGQQEAAFGSPGRGLVVMGMAVIYVQILLGALVRHTGAGRVCGTDFLLCGGVAWPDFHPSQMHMAHRVVGYLAFGVVLVVSLRAAAAARRHGRRLARFAALAAPTLALVQVMLGMLTVATGVGVHAATAHLGGGALLFAALLVTHLALGPQVNAARAAGVRPAEASA
jgi:heme A synthase